MDFTGTFQILDWQESTEQALNMNTKVSKALIKQQYSGVIQGSSNTHYLLYYSEDGDATFTGFEVITGNINEQAYQLTLKHNGHFINGVASSQFVIIQSVPESHLLGKSGRFDSTETGKANYSFSE